MSPTPERAKCDVAAIWRPGGKPVLGGIECEAGTATSREHVHPEVRVSSDAIATANRDSRSIGREGNRVVPPRFTSGSTDLSGPVEPGELGEEPGRASGP